MATAIQVDSVQALPDSEPDNDKSIPVFSCVKREDEFQYPCIMSDEAMDAEEKEFDLDMDIIESPLARPQEVPREKGRMLKCVYDLYVRASKNLSITESAKVKELLVEHNKTTFHDPEKSLTTTNTIEHEIPMTGRLSGYWQIKVVDKDREKTAFGSHLGLYEFLYMPVGLTGAPATFSRLMDKVLDGLICKKCLVYLDDVIIFGSSFEETLANLKLVMNHLREHNLLCKARKCELFEMSIAFLGHVVSEEGINTDPAKVEKICNLSAPKDKSGIRSILELGNNYKRFIKSYCVKNSPSTGIVEEVCPLHVETFINLKDALCKAPVLAYPNHDLPYVVDTVDSNLAIGAVLLQVQDGEEKVIMYGFESLLRVSTMMVYDKKRTLCYSSFCNNEVLLLLVKPVVHTPYRPFIVKVARLIP